MNHAQPYDPLHITDRDRLFELLALERRGKSRVIDPADMQHQLSRRVIGQDHILAPIARALRLQWGKQQRNKPIANLLFVGPPATGKTELAMAITEYLFDREEAILRFEGAELVGAEAKTRLIGTPTGYVGANQGGQLTRPVLTNPKRLILFDEIEKAHAGVCDLFLAMMGEGRLTEQGSNKTADFTQAVIILTSNVEHEALAQLDGQTDDPLELDQQVRTVLRDAKAFRPEIVSRLDHIFLFRQLDQDAIARVTALKIVKAAEQYGVELEYIEPEIVQQILVQTRAMGDSRGLVRVVDDQLGETLIAARDQGLTRVRIERAEDDKPTAYPATARCDQN